MPAMGRCCDSFAGIALPALLPIQVDSCKSAAARAVRKSPWAILRLMMFPFFSRSYYTTDIIYFQTVDGKKRLFFQTIFASRVPCSAGRQCAERLDARQGGFYGTENAVLPGRRGERAASTAAGFARSGGGNLPGLPALFLRVPVAFPREIRYHISYELMPMGRWRDSLDQRTACENPQFLHYRAY